MANVSNAMEIQACINGDEVSETIPVRMHAADFLRKQCGLTGVHIGCEQGVCGMCTVLVDAEAVKSCLMLAVQLDQCEVRTVESLRLANDWPTSTTTSYFPTDRSLSGTFCPVWRSITAPCINAMSSDPSGSTMRIGRILP